MTNSSTLEGIAAYSQYEQDGQANEAIWRKLRQQDEAAVRRLTAQLERYVQKGKPRARER